jgi:hypothetical protein
MGEEVGIRKGSAVLLDYETYGEGGHGLLTKFLSQSAEIAGEEMTTDQL